MFYTEFMGVFVISSHTMFHVINNGGLLVTAASPEAKGLCYHFRNLRTLLELYFRLLLEIRLQKKCFLTVINYPFCSTCLQNQITGHPSRPYAPNSVYQDIDDDEGGGDDDKGDEEEGRRRERKRDGDVEGKDRK